MPESRHLDTFDECGNLFGAGIPVNLDRAISDGQLQVGRRDHDGGVRACRRFRRCRGGALGRPQLMAEPALATSVTAEIVASLPQAVDPLALSLNESPFPPLPAVRSALVRCLDAANRYPEFLPGQLPRMIADRIGVLDDQVVVGPGASGVAMQVLHAVTRPGDRIVMSTPTFDGYPIFARMARLTAVTVPLDRYGYQDLVTMAEAATDAKVVVLCRPHNPTGTLEAISSIEWFLNRDPRRHHRAARRGVYRVRRAAIPDRRSRSGPPLPECRCAANVLQGIRTGGAAHRLRVRRARVGRDGVGSCSCRSG